MTHGLEMFMSGEENAIKCVNMIDFSSGQVITMM
jgi:hypothetical protein